MTARTLFGALARNAATRPAVDAIGFLAGGEELTATITYAALQRGVDEVAAGLVARELAGKPVLLALPPGLEFVVGFLATLRAGAFAVTIPFPVGTSAERVAAIVRDAQPAAALVDGPGAEYSQGALAGIPAVSLERLRATRALPGEPPPHCPALIQYSSGSTRKPCGVAITHGNLAANLLMIERAFDVRHDDLTVSWLPPSHDMGLIGAILEPIFAGGKAMLMPPSAFMKKPVRWLRAIDRYRATIAGGPNFAYELCARRATAEAARELDLASWRVAFCGSEPIRFKTLQSFAERFAAAGFARSSFLACYGLAETTLLSSAGPLREVALDGFGSRVSCGRPVPGCAVVARPPVGELWVSGPHVSPGRWSGATGAVVRWENTFEEAGRRFLPTGDIGALLNGEVVVLDRVKDVIALYGRKVHSIDVEHAVLDAESAVSAVAAFATASERGERLVAVCELSARDRAGLDIATMKASLSASVSARTGVAPEIVLVRYGVLPRTASGKIRRDASRVEFVAGNLRQL